MCEQRDLAEFPSAFAANLLDGSMDRVLLLPITMFRNVQFKESIILFNLYESLVSIGLKLSHVGNFLDRLQHQVLHDNEIGLSIFFDYDLCIHRVHQTFKILLNELNQLIGHLEEFFIEESIEELISLETFRLSNLERFTR